MSDKFLNKYRIPSSRAFWHDYSSNGLYYITICSAGRECLFGEIIDKEIKYSQIGEIVLFEWEKSFLIRAELFCEQFVLMPNHLHAILRIDNNNVETHGRASLQMLNNGIAFRAPKSISSFVAGFISAATKRVNEFRDAPRQPLWQSRFHDHIIRDEVEFTRINEYIKNNPKNWDSDNYTIIDLI